MKRRTHPIDDLFREALNGHQILPSDASRRRFLREASTPEVRGRGRRTPWLLSVAGLIVIVTTAVLVYLSSPKAEKRDGTSDTVESGEFASGSGQVVLGGGQAVLGGGQAVSESGQVVSGGGQAVSESGQVVPLIAAPAFDSSILVSVTPEEVVQLPDTTSPEVPVPTDPIPPVPADEPAFASSFGLLTADDTIQSEGVLLADEPVARMKIPRTWQAGVSVHYSPEWMFNTLEGEKYVNNFGLEGNIAFGRYSLRTGIGISITTGTNELMVEYNDYMGSYNHLDSIQFHWDDRNYHLLPTYYMSKQDVWDSLLRLDYPCLLKRYTYLQIPLILGYDFLRKKWLSLGLRAGPIVSVLVQSKQLSDAYDPGKNRIVRINRVTPDRIQTNWQVMGGLNASFRLSRRIKLEFEPTVKYYFNSVYEKSDITKKPWSAGFRTAVVVLF